MLLKEYKFGYADATKELIIEPEIFEKAFYDSHNILDKLMNSWKYMLVGRKVRNFFVPTKSSSVLAFPNVVYSKSFN